ncbi:MAG: c-type cytochrome [Caldimonas sp.]
MQWERLLAAACLGVLLPAHGQDAMPRQPVATGALVEQVCAACHGVDGKASRPDVPLLAGQTAPYLERQLRAFAAQGGQRENGVMGAIAVNLSSDEIRRVSLHYARQTLPAAPPVAAPPPSRDAGERIFTAGLPGKGVASCASCHGVRGEGLPDLFPRLAGQHAGYLREQLRNFRAGRRTSDPGAMMRALAARMTDRDIDAVARYASLLK